MLQPRVVRQDDVEARAVTKKSDDARMRAFQHANDPAFGAVPVGKSGAPLNFCYHVIAMHGVFDGQPRNKHVAVKFGNRFIRDDKTVAIVMQHKAAAGLVPIPFSRRAVAGLPVAQPIPPARNFVDGAPLF